MTETTYVAPAPKKRGGWLRVVGLVLGALLVLLIVVYLVATSSAFFKGVILPKVSQTVNATITVDSASISPFSHVFLTNLKVQTTGSEPLVSVAEVRLRYSLLAIMRGNMVIDEVTVASPSVLLTQNPDGTSNLDPLMKAQAQKAPEAKPAKPGQPAPSKPLQIDLKKLAVTDATFRQVKLYANGQREVAELSHLNLTLDNVKNGQTGRLALGGEISLQQTNGLLQAKLDGNYTLALAADLKPNSIKGNTILNVTRAQGALAEAAEFGSDLSVDVTPTDVKEVALRFHKAKASLGELRVSGPFDMQKVEGRLSIVLAGIDKQLLNLAGTRNGMDFGGTTIGSTNEVALTQGGRIITARGQLSVNSFQLTRTNQTTPRLDLTEAYDVTVDRAQSAATLRNLMLSGTQNGNSFLKAELTSPMLLSWGNVSNAVGDSALTMTVANFNLADWKPFLGDSVSAGMVNMTTKILSQQGGKNITLAFDSTLEHLTVAAGTNRISDATITMHADVKAADLKQFTLSSYKLEVAHQNETIATATGSGTYDQAAQTADMQFATQALLGPLLRTMPQPNMNISSGTVQFNAHVTQKQGAQAVTGGLTLADFSGRFSTNEIRALGTAVTFDVGMATQQVQIRKIEGKLTQAGNAAGSFAVSGTYDSGTTNADVQAVAQLTLPTLLQAMPQPNMSVSSGAVVFKAHVTQKQQTQGLTGNMSLADFSARFGTNEVRGLGSEVEFDMGTTARQAEIRRLAGQVTQGTNIGGAFDVSGSYDLVNTNGSLSAKLVDLNQIGVGAFLQPALGARKLVSVSINAIVNAQYDPASASSVKADFRLSNLVVKDPAMPSAAAPLEATMHLDASLNKKVADLRQFQVSLTPTARATNQVQLSGQLDMSRTNAIQGNLKLVADSLDFTGFYDVFTAGKQPPAKGPTPGAPPTASTPAPVPGPAGPEKEPEPMILPLSNFVAQASIGRLYVREVEIANWQTTTKVDGGHVVVNPFKLALNGAPVTSSVDLDLGVAGWKYDTSWSAQAIPLAPLVNTFQPERKGQVGGTATVQGHITGAGITGASLQKNLAGNFDVNTTNLDLNVINIKSPVLKTLINVVAGIPELIRNPVGTASSLLGSLMGQAGTKGGLADDLQKSPINSIIVQGTAGAGRIELKKAVVQSPAFEADVSHGTVDLATVLTNSTLLVPVQVSLSRPIAQKLGLVAANTPTNAPYAKLPDFFTMTGTVGAPKSKIDYVALASVAGKSVSGAFKELGGGVGGVLGGILGNTSGGSTNQPGTTSTNQSPVNSLIKGLFGPKKK